MILPPVFLVKSLHLRERLSALPPAYITPALQRQYWRLQQQELLHGNTRPLLTGDLTAFLSAVAQACTILSAEQDIDGHCQVPAAPCPAVFEPRSLLLTMTALTRAAVRHRQPWQLTVHTDEQRAMLVMHTVPTRSLLAIAQKTAALHGGSLVVGRHSLGMSLPLNGQAVGLCPLPSTEALLRWPLSPVRTGLAGL